MHHGADTGTDTTTQPGNEVFRLAGRASRHDVVKQVRAPLRLVRRESSAHSGEGGPRAFKLIDGAGHITRILLRP